MKLREINFEANKKTIEAENLAYAYTAMGYVYAKQGRHKEAIATYKKVLVCYAEYDRSNYTDYQMGQTHSRMANSYMELKNYSEAVSHSEKALELAKPMNDKYLTVVDLCRIGLVKMEQSKFDEAEKIFNEALALQAPKGTEANEHAFISAYLSMAKLYFRKQDWTKAGFYAEIEENGKTYISEVLAQNEPTLHCQIRILEFDGSKEELFGLVSF